MEGSGDGRRQRLREVTMNRTSCSLAISTLAFGAAALTATDADGTRDPGAQLPAVQLPGVQLPGVLARRANVADSSGLGVGGQQQGRVLAGWRIRGGRCGPCSWWSVAVPTPP